MTSQTARPLIAPHHHEHPSVIDPPETDDEPLPDCPRKLSLSRSDQRMGVLDS